MKCTCKSVPGIQQLMGHEIGCPMTSANPERDSYAATTERGTMPDDAKDSLERARKWLLANTRHMGDYEPAVASLAQLLDEVRAEAADRLEQLEAEVAAAPALCDCHPGVRWPVEHWGKPCPLTAERAAREQAEAELADWKRPFGRDARVRREALEEAARTAEDDTMVATFIMWRDKTPDVAADAKSIRQAIAAAIRALPPAGSPNEAASGNETSGAAREQASTRVAPMALRNDASMPPDANEAKPQTGSSLGAQERETCFVCGGTGTRGVFTRDTPDGEEAVPASRCIRCGGTGIERAAQPEGDNR